MKCLKCQKEVRGVNRICGSCKRKKREREKASSFKRSRTDWDQYQSVRLDKILLRQSKDYRTEAELWAEIFKTEERLIKEEGLDLVDKVNSLFNS